MSEWWSDKADGVIYGTSNWTRMLGQCESVTTEWWNHWADGVIYGTSELDKM